MSLERHHTDDDIKRWRAVYLGPDKGDKGGITLPWTASYVAYGIWLVTFVVILLFEAVTPMHVGLPPVREFAVSVLIATYLGGKVDHDRPFSQLAPTLLQNLRSPRPITKTTRTDHRYSRVRIEDRS